MPFFLEKPVILVGGPTASGKSGYALDLAQAYQGVIINGDSMQIYQTIPTLTAQPSPADQQKVPHKLYGILSSQEACSVAQWHHMACDEIDQCHRTGQFPIVVGGTGLYLDTLIHGLCYVPDIDPLIRQDVRNFCEKEGPESLHQKLSDLDPAMAAKLHPRDKQRLTRAYEVIKSTGKSLLYWQEHQDTSRIKFYHVHKILIQLPREILYQRAAQRLEKMLQTGAVDEVRELLEHNPDPQAGVMQALGVREITSYLHKKISYEDMYQQILLKTRHYIKRQLTWFRRSFQDAQKIDFHR